MADEGSIGNLIHAISTLQPKEFDELLKAIEDEKARRGLQKKPKRRIAYATFNKGL